jgi:high-affinity nickel-transport protein
MLPFIAAVSALHALAAVLIIVAKSHWPMMLGFAGVAYALGLRHAFDADHIVAIDGTTRQLLARGRNASGVGFFFSLGHSTVVLALALWVAHATQAGARRLALARDFGGGFGLATSSAFMFLVAALNVLIFADALAALRATKASGAGGGELDVPRSPGGIMSRVFAPALRVVTRAPHMYLVGFLFGLGFDTASEIALLAIAATAGARDLPMPALLVLPLSFAAGMSLADTAEGFFMSRAYAWAQDEPARRARYNLVVTGFTAVAAVTVAALELSGFSWGRTSLDPTVVGLIIVGAFPVLWVIAAMNARAPQRRRDRASS